MTYIIFTLFGVSEILTISPVHFHFLAGLESSVAVYSDAEPVHRARAVSICMQKVLYIVVCRFCM